MNEHGKVVAKDLAQGLVHHGSVRRGSQTVTKFELHHRECRFNVRSLVVVGQEVIPAIHEVTEIGWPATMESAVRSGYLAAEGILSAAGSRVSLLRPDL